ncbi:serine/threonine-protein kinase [Sorangium sp. So ce1182]|uniref:serine/threonine-protein kinase n=1 Tax=Sorangium sp. So ce1182 TaxID=3133334 RepID=UPI003F61C8B3
MIGTLIEGKYRILRQLGAGAMGAVYQAEHTGTGRRVALKVITGELASRQDIVDRFWREAKAAGRIDTDHITQVLDSGVDRDMNLPYLVMEFLSGEDLQGFLKKTGPIAPDVALRVIAQACLGLRKAHEAGVVHRDIKPANLFLARREAGEMLVKILDFGIAKVVMEQAQETETAGLTKTGSLLGSPLFMSPEQALGSKHVDHRSDLWSLGISLYQALSARTPFDHITAMGQLVVEINYGRLAPVQERAPWVPPEVAAVVDRALQRKPNERFQSATEMLDAIAPLLPHGWALTESMLTPVPEALRARVAPRLMVSSSPSLPEIPAPTFLPQDPQASQASPHPGNTAGAMARSQVAPPRGSPAKALLAVGAAALVTAGVVAGGYLAVRRASSTGVAVQAEARVGESIKAAIPAPPPSSAPAPEPKAPAVPPEPPTRTVELRTSPVNASVEVDGKLVPSKNGIVKLTGELGSVHRVRVFIAPRYSTEKSVVVTAEGPMPALVVMPFTPVGVRPQSGSGTGPAAQPQRRKFE